MENMNEQAPESVKRVGLVLLGIVMGIVINMFMVSGQIASCQQTLKIDDAMFRAPAYGALDDATDFINNNAEDRGKHYDRCMK